MNYQIFDNILPQEEFIFLKNKISNEIDWKYNQTIVDPSVKEKFPHVGFTHTFFTLNDYGIPIFSKSFDILHPLISFIKDNLNYLCLIRAKANMYVNQNEYIYHTPHTDYKFPVKTALFYINNNNGVTVLNLGNEKIIVESKENRIIVFDSEILHQGTNCTDDYRRLNVNLNFI